MTEIVPTMFWLVIRPTNRLIEKVLLPSNQTSMPSYSTSSKHYALNCMTTGLGLIFLMFQIIHSIKLHNIVCYKFFIMEIRMKK